MNEYTPTNNFITDSQSEAPEVYIERNDEQFNDAFELNIEMIASCMVLLFYVALENGFLQCD